MFTILNRYLFGQLFLATCFIALALTSALWLSQSLRFIDLVVCRGFSLSVFLKMVFFLLPDLIGLVLPLATLIAVLFTYNRLLGDHELIIMRASGLSNLALSLPALSFSVGVVTVLYALNLYILPLSFQKFKDIEHDIRNQLTSYLIQPGEFTTLKGITVYVKERRPKGELRGILLHDARDPSAPFTLVAQKGVVRETATGLTVSLVEGNRQQIDGKTGKPNLLLFDHYTLELSLAPEKKSERSRKPYERFLTDLLNPDLQIESPKMVKRLYAEAHQRLLLPLTVLCFTGLALSFFLSGEYDRRRRAKKIIFALGACGFLESFLMGLIHLSDRWKGSIPAAYGVIIFFFLAALVGIREKGSLKEKGL